MSSPPVAYFHLLLSPSLFLSQSFLSLRSLGNIFVGTMRVPLLSFVPVNVVLSLPFSQLALHSLTLTKAYKKSGNHLRFYFRGWHLLLLFLVYTQQVSWRDSEVAKKS